jgi:hypothetical protein
MRWENIQTRLRYRLGTLFSQEQSIRSIVRDVDDTLEAFVIWHGSAVDCWSGILREARIRHLELDIIEAAQMTYKQDEELQKAKDDIIVLNKTSALGTKSTVDSEPAQLPQTQSSKQANGTGPIEVFISYAEDDERFKKQLEAHLTPLKREGIIRPWHSQQAQVGQAQGRKQEIANHIDSAQIILLLMSPSFLASDQLYDDEMTRAIKRQESGDAVRVIRITVRHIDSGNPDDLDSPDKTPLQKLQKLQGLPRNGRPIEAWRSTDEAWAMIAQEIRQVCKNLRDNSGNSL